MISTTFRSVSEPVAQPVVERGPDPEPNNTAADGNFQDIAPIEVLEAEGKDVLLMALGIDDRINNMPAEDQSAHEEVKRYVMQVIDKKGLTPTTEVFKNVLDGLKWDMGLDQEADPSTVLKRIGGVIDAWKNVSFIKNPQEKRSIFMKLGRARSNEEMNRIVFESWERAKVWQ